MTFLLFFAEFKGILLEQNERRRFIGSCFGSWHIYRPFRSTCYLLECGLAFLLSCPFSLKKKTQKVKVLAIDKTRAEHGQGGRKTKQNKNRTIDVLNFEHLTQLFALEMRSVRNGRVRGRFWSTHCSLCPLAPPPAPRPRAEGSR